MVVVGIHGSCYPIMTEFLVDAFRFQIIQCDQDDISSTLHEISTMLDRGSSMICVDNIKTLKQYRALRCFFGCVIIRIKGLNLDKRMKPDYVIEKPGNGIEVRNIIYDLM